jgi:hypothetical protein
MPGGGALRAFFKGAQEDAAQAVESAAGKMAGLGEDTAQGVRDSVSTIRNADGANADAARGIRGLPRGGAGAGGSSQISRALNPGDGAGHSATFGHADNFDYKKTFFGEHPELEGKVVVHHAVEQQTLKRYPGTVSPNEMHSLENLRGIPKGEVNNRVHLSQLRKEWNRFYRDNPNPSQQQLLDHATKLDKKYGSEFNPPIK